MATKNGCLAVDTMTELSVSGYIRINHKLLSNLSQYRLFQNVPDSIYSLCILYYHIYDHFHTINKHIQLADDNKTISQTKPFDWQNTCYGEFRWSEDFLSSYQ